MARSKPPLELYHQIIDDRPKKLTEDEVNYRESDDKHKCGNCVHFYERAVDDFLVCELMRPDLDGPVIDSHVCDFWTLDGENFPLLCKHD